MDFTNIIGRKLKAASLDSDKSSILFIFQDGFERRFGVEGECCSSSWIEHLEMPNDIDGAVLIAVNNGASITQDHNEHDDGEDIKVYNTSFRTDRGEIVLEYRNSSNGYYGGYLVDIK